MKRLTYHLGQLGSSGVFADPEERTKATEIRNNASDRLPPLRRSAMIQTVRLQVHGKNKQKTSLEEDSFKNAFQGHCKPKHEKENNISLKG